MGAQPGRRPSPARLGLRLDIMSVLTYRSGVSPSDKPLVWLHGEVRTPPLSQAARIEAGFLLRRLQRGESLALPASRPMPSIGRRCHELRINDENATWRILYRRDPDAILILEVFSKKTTSTPKAMIESAQMRLKQYEALLQEEDDGEVEEG